LHEQQAAVAKQAAMFRLVVLLVLAGENCRLREQRYEEQQQYEEPPLVGEKLSRYVAETRHALNFELSGNTNRVLQNTLPLLAFPPDDTL
jgi:hypothetical protein